MGYAERNVVLYKGSFESDQIKFICHDYNHHD